MTFTAPALLWGLAGLLIPIGIHLLSRAEGRVIRVGSIRHFSESSTSRFKSLRPNELMLLLVRCLVITALVFLLSGMRCSTYHEASKCVLIEPGLENNPLIGSRLDSFESGGYELRSLSDGLPPLDDHERSETADYWHLVTSEKVKEFNDVIVFTTNEMTNFQGKRPTLPENVHWIVISRNAEKSFLQSATRQRDNRVLLTHGKSTENETSFQKESFDSDEFRRLFGDSVELQAQDTLRVSIISDKDHVNDARILRAALTSLQTQTITVQFEEIPDGSDWLFWLKSEKIPDNKQRIFYLNEKPTTYIIEQTSGNRWAITKRLSEGVALSDHLVIELGKIMLEKTDVAKHDDIRVLPEVMAWSDTNEGAPQVEIEKTSDMSNILTFTLLALILFERLLSQRKNL